MLPLGPVMLIFHKNLSTLQNSQLHFPPELPLTCVISLFTCTENASSFVDKQPRPHVEALPSYVKDIMHVLTLLDGICVTEHTILECIDLESLY